MAREIHGGNTCAGCQPGSVSTRRRPLLLLEAATLVSGAGNGVAMVALPWLALELTGSAAAAGAVATAAALPLIFASLFSGTVVDIFGRRRTAIVADLFSLVSVAAIPIAHATIGLNLGLLIALAALCLLYTSPSPRD